MEGREKMTLNELVEKLKGRPVKSISGLKKDSDQVTLFFGDEYTIEFNHQQDCCETVCLVDHELQGKMKGELIYIKELSNRDEPPNDWDSHTWTFYEVRTTEGLLTMRWLGTSSGYYSEEVSVSFGKEDANHWNRDFVEFEE